jgi:hypothetical protein
MAAGVVDFPTSLHGTVDTYNAYSQAAGGGAFGVLAGLSGATGVAGLAEAGYGYDIPTGAELSTQERVIRAATGLGAVAGIAMSGVGFAASASARLGTIAQAGGRFAGAARVLNTNVGVLSRYARGRVVRSLRSASTRHSVLRSGDDVIGNRVVNTGGANRPVTTIDDLLSSNTMPGQSGVVLNQRTVVFDDIWKLSARDAAEYVLTREGGQYVLRNGISNRVSIPRGVRPIAHTHPPDVTGFVDQLPSRADINLLNFLWSRNSNGPRPMSQIITGQGQTTVFRATGIDQILRTKVRR